MLYLATQSAWFLLAAFVMGLVFGWLTGRGGPRGFASGPVMGLAILWAGLAGLVWLRLVNDQAAFWIETALLYLLAYAAGCLIGSLFAGEGEALPALAAPAPRLALPQPAPALPSPSLPMATVGARTTEPDPMPKVENEDAIAGKRPVGFAAARGGQADDLKLIKGIGPQNEERLHALGIWHFSQIAAWTPENVAWVGTYLAFPGRIEREDWVAQAAALARTATTVEPVTAAPLSGVALEGKRPGNLLPGARGGKPDDLGLIDGVGPAIAETLNGLGIWHFDQIVALGPDELRFLAHHTGFPGRDIAEQWQAEAKILAAGGETEHSRAMKAKRRKRKR
jgi:predicted flap endonuclease-1-like 5' DNA nuclease